MNLPDTHGNNVSSYTKYKTKVKLYKKNRSVTYNAAVLLHPLSLVQLAAIPELCTRTWSRENFVELIASIYY